MVTKHLDVWWFFKLDPKTKFASLQKQQMVFHLPHGQNLILSPIFRSFDVMHIYYMKSTHFTHKIRYQETNFDHLKKLQHIVHTIAMHSCRTIFQPLLTFFGTIRLTWCHLWIYPSSLSWLQASILNILRGVSADVILLELSIPHYLHVGASPPVIDSGRKKLQLQRGVSPWWCFGHVFVHNAFDGIQSASLNEHNICT